MRRFQDMVAIVTGGSSGIGRATALALAKAGAKVVITGRGREALEATSGVHANIVGLVADVALPDDTHRTIGAALDRWGRLDVLINNAGAGAIMALAEATPERITEILAVNVLGSTLLAQAALPHLAAEAGSIVNVSSTFGHRPAAGLSHYAAAKAALEHLTRCWALELAPQKVRVNAVAAGPTASGALTGMMALSTEQAALIEAEEQARIPLQRRGTPADIARWILQFADRNADWITGEVLTVDGGLGLT